jgi:hypothetical protein
LQRLLQPIAAANSWKHLHHPCILLPHQNERATTDIKMVVADTRSTGFTRHRFFYLEQPAKSKRNR